MTRKSLELHSFFWGWGGGDLTELFVSPRLMYMSEWHMAVKMITQYLLITHVQCDAQFVQVIK